MKLWFDTVQRLIFYCQAASITSELVPVAETQKLTSIDTSSNIKTYCIVVEKADVAKGAYMSIVVAMRLIAEQK